VFCVGLRSDCEKNAAFLKKAAQKTFTPLNRELRTPMTQIQKVFLLPFSSEKEALTS
jgi:hypothetical protein